MDEMPRRRRYSVRGFLRGFKRDEKWQHFLVGNIHHTIVPGQEDHQVFVQQRLDHTSVVDLTFRHAECCECPEAIGAPRVEAPKAA